MTTHADIQRRLLTPTDTWTYLLEINHPAVGEPVRLCVDTAPFTHLGKQYMPIAAQINLPKDESGQVASASITLDNVNKTLTRIVESTNGLGGSTVDLKVVYRQTPDVTEYESNFDLTNITMNKTTLTATLSYDRIMDRISAPLTYRPTIFKALI
jgi:phage-related protein